MKEKYIPFNIEAAKKGSRVMTKGGIPARIICFDMENEDNQLVVLLMIEGKECVAIYRSDGTLSNSRDDSDTLVMTSVEKNGWFIVYHGYEVSFEGPFESEAEAMRHVDQYNDDDFMSITFIEWLEPIGAR